MAKRQNRILITLARQGRLEGDDGFRQMLDEATKMAVDLDYSEKPYFRSALWEATWKNHEAIVRLLVDKGASVFFPDYQQRTPLHEAAFYGHMNLVEYFLFKGHPIDAMDSFGQTPLFRAVEAGRDEIVQYLIERQASTNVLDTDDVTAQHLAAFQGMPQMSWWLLYKGAWKNRFAIESSEKPKALEVGATSPPQPKGVVAPQKPKDGATASEGGEAKTRVDVVS